MGITVKDLVKENKMVTFVFYRAGNMYYRTEDGYEFPVPLSDVGNATLLGTDKAIYFMRYIRKHLEATRNT